MSGSAAAMTLARRFKSYWPRESVPACAFSVITRRLRDDGRRSPSEVTRPVPAKSTTRPSVTGGNRRGTAESKQSECRMSHVSSRGAIALPQPVIDEDRRRRKRRRRVHLDQFEADALVGTAQERAALIDGVAPEPGQTAAGEAVDDRVGDNARGVDAPLPVGVGEEIPQRIAEAVI